MLQSNLQKNTLSTYNATYQARLVACVIDGRIRDGEEDDALGEGVLDGIGQVRPPVVRVTVPPYVLHEPKPGRQTQR